MKPFNRVAVLVFLAGCTTQDPAASTTANGDVGRTTIFNDRLSAEMIHELDHAVVDEGHQPWRMDVEWVAESEMMAHLEADEKSLQGPTHALYDVRRRGSTAIVKIQWQRNITAEVFLENTRTGGTGCWFADHLVITRLKS